ncbi:hypothetical protein H4696_003274 [Amycolatopsis lexingtonensis]|uniref:Uncharacterized protein n=1 Tax=Amycolatopsis lexingtonensis TaxID=218822 RepID=A0ABR9HZ12_9PSEU|nr:hypothetical protein [Amycolatopsis lexingtonensis]MBE1496174.1 hypothetical protein [Amycolatopsis lexingtonensis]
MHELDRGHAVLAAQHLLDTVLTTGTATFGRYTASPAHRLLTDPAVLASRILRTAEAPCAADPDIGDPSDATTRALSVLGAADETNAVALLASLCASGSAGRSLVAPHHSRQRPITPQLACVLQQARRTLNTRSMTS